MTETRGIQLRNSELLSNISSCTDRLFRAVGERIKIMKAKKLISALAAFGIVMSMVVAPVQANSLSIKYPLDGDEITELKSISIEAEEGEKVIVTLDGKNIASFVSNGSDELPLENELFIGEHELTVTQLGDHSDSATSVFKVCKEINTELYNDTMDGGTSKALKPITEGVSMVIGKNAEGQNVSVMHKSFPGKGDDENTNGAVGFYVNEDVTEPANAKYDIVNAYYLLNDIKSKPWIATYEIEYDLKMFEKGYFELETKNADSKWGWIGTGNFLQGDGTVKGTGYSYPVGEWMHIRHVVDTEKGVESLYIDDNLLMDKRPTANLKNLVQLKFQFGTDSRLCIKKGYGAAIDNLHIVNYQSTRGISSVSFDDGSGKYNEAAGNIIDKASNKLMFTIPMPLEKNITDEEAKSKIKIFADGKELEISKASVDENGNIFAELAENLPNIADVRAEFTCSSADGSDVVMGKRFKSRNVTFGITDTEIWCDGAICRTSEQMQPGSDVAALFTLKNETDEDKSAVLILAVYSGNRLASMITKTVNVSAMKSSYSDSLRVTLPDKGEKFSAECYLFDSYKTRLPISKVWSVK